MFTGRGENSLHNVPCLLEGFDVKINKNINKTILGIFLSDFLSYFFLVKFCTASYISNKFIQIPLIFLNVDTNLWKFKQYSAQGVNSCHFKLIPSVQWASRNFFESILGLWPSTVPFELSFCSKVQWNRVCFECEVISNLFDFQEVWFFEVSKQS